MLSARHSPTIGDLASALHLSISSVSCALNGRAGVSEATRRRVVEYADRVGYRPTSSARALSQARADAVGIVVRESLAIVGAEAYYLRFLAGVAPVLDAAGRALILELSEGGLEDELEIYRKWAAERRVDGVVLLDEPDEDRRVALLDSLGLPAVLHGPAPAQHPGHPGILVDEAADAATIVGHLANQGARYVLHAAGPQRHRHEQIRLASVRWECERRGLDYACSVGSYGLADGDRAGQTIARSNGERPDALIAANDLVAAGACRALSRAGIRIPEQCCVVAWDDSVMCEVVQPAISALNRRPEEFGSIAASRLLDVLDRYPDEKTGPQIAAASVMIKRESTSRRPMP